jgi:hypothetical protein
MRHARAKVLLGGAVLASLQGDPGAAIPWLQESAALFRDVGDESGEAYALAYHGVSWGQSADSRAVEPTTRALAYFRTSGDLYGLRLCLVVLATYYGSVGEAARARETGEEAVVVARTFGLDRELAIALQVLAAVHLAGAATVARTEGARAGIGRRAAERFFACTGPRARCFSLQTREYVAATTSAARDYLASRRWCVRRSAPKYSVRTAPTWSARSLPGAPPWAMLHSMRRGRPDETCR